MFGNSRRPLSILLSAVGVVLLIACANVANLLLAKTSSRRGELALRLALGATRGRIIRLILTESLLLALLGGLAGIGVAAFAIEPLSVFTGVGDLQRVDIGLNGPVLLFAVAASLATGVIFGLLPALRAAGPDVAAFLKDDSRTSSGSRRGLQSALIVSETGLTVVLLVVAGLLIRSFVNASGEDVGFVRHGALTFRLTQSGDTAQTVEKRLQFADRVLAELEAIPGVERAGFISNMPMNGRRFFGDSVHRADQPVEDANIGAGFDAVSPGYFEAMRIPILRGRNLTAADNRVEAHKVMLVNRAMVDRFFDDGEDPLGGRIMFKGAPYEIVGVVADTRRFAVDAPPQLQVYLPLAHFPWTTHYVVRTALPALALAPDVRRAVQRVNADQPIHELDTLEDLTRGTLRTRTIMLTLLSLFAGVALLLACVGIYGVMAYSVSQRTREMGIRLALGATRQNLVRLVVRDGLRLVGLGLAIGALIAGFATRFLQSQLYNVGQLDPVTFAGVCIVLVAVGTAACLLPARRAARVDPITSLRAE
jgi:predicted permease